MNVPKRILAAARLLLGKTQAEVARDSGLSTKTVVFVEKGTASLESVVKLTEHYQENGIQFLEPADGKGWGIRTTFLLRSYHQERH
ncbi:hypothetical protein CYG48_13425 [Neorhizobium sp. SOG26]|uniref:helix-turn-helix domain-containing protein n=1 Tax=Neorhizobium sp. SOG26 TaxID=2060726 RepID=UPI000E5821AE|nr:helix-turn-helix transcriptional regulator [Neorhizobium sp. SOG26]AXV16599.1 hypothetical protein CYG48_13425 [Neorhizobium sp. SOG26]